MAHRALKKPGEDIRRAGGAAVARALTWPTATEPPDNFDPLTHGRPKFLGDDSLLGDLSPAPLARELPPIDALARFLRPHLLRFPPDHHAAVALIAENVADRRRAPAPRDSSLLRLWREDSLIVEIDGDAFHRIARGVPLENSPHGGRLVGIHLELHSRDDRPAMAVAFCAALDWHASISEDAAARVQPVEGELLDAAESLLGEFLEIERIHQPVNGEEGLRLRSVGVEALADEHDTDLGKLQLLHDSERVLQVAAHSAGVVHEHHIERAWFLPRRGQKPSQACAIVCRPGDRLVCIDMRIQNVKAVAAGEFAALPDLLVNRKSILLFRTKSRVDCATCGFYHGLTSLRPGAAVLLPECAASASRSASSFSRSSRAMYCFTSTGTIAASMKAFSSGVSGDSSACRRGLGCRRLHGASTIRSALSLTTLPNASP
ncbi:MAG TPA: hypothetical protein VNY24_00575 [Candidatus Acidoferrales bacterium]|nr:hypothetical protein [Candidatus Acidoferrales bacterium]